MEKSAYIHTADYFFDCLWLVDRQSLREPYELLTSNIPDLLLIARPGEFPVFKTFIQQQKAVIFPQKYLHTISATTTEQKRTVCCEQVELKLLLYKCCQPVNGLPHIRMSADDVDIVSSQVFQHSFRPLSSVSRSLSDISAGISTSIPSLRTIIFCGTAGSDFPGSALSATHCVCTAAVVQVTL